MSKPRDDAAGAWLILAVILVGLSQLVMFLFRSVLDEAPFLVGLILLVLPVAGGMVGWNFGVRDGKSMRERALLIEKEAETAKMQAQSDLEAAAKQVQLASVYMTQAQAMESASLSRMAESDRSTIEHIRELPVEGKLHAILHVGKFPEETDGEHVLRRNTLVRKRARQWEQARRFNYHLLSIVERQGGLCGDLTRDPSLKGCGSYLYTLPPSCVHYDHIVPKSRGGSDTMENIQALCTACNLSAGNRTKN